VGLTLLLHLHINKTTTQDKDIKHHHCHPVPQEHGYLTGTLLWYPFNAMHIATIPPFHAALPRRILIRIPDDRSIDQPINRKTWINLFYSITMNSISSTSSPPRDASDIKQDTIASSDRTFTPFPRLPQEIRLMIWHFALPGPRIVPLLLRPAKICPHIWYRIRSDVPTGTCAFGAKFPCTGFFEKRPRKMKDDKWKLFLHFERFYGGLPYQGFRSDCPPPALLSVCHESRELASKLYSRHFSTAWACAETYFNLAIDTVHIDHNSVRYFDPRYRTSILAVHLGGDAQLIENLSVHVGLYTAHTGVSSWISDILHHFRNLKKLTIVDDDYTSFVQSKDMSDEERNRFETHVERYKYSVISVEAREQQLRLYEGTLTSKQRSADLAFVDVVDIGDALTMLKKKVDATEFHDHSPIAKTVTITDYSAIEEQSRHDWQAIFSGRAPFKIPVIEHKVLTTTKMKVELERAWKEYRNTSTCPCREPAPQPSSAGAARWLEIDRQAGLFQRS
jgi:hypothetical protein